MARAGDLGEQEVEHPALQVVERHLRLVDAADEALEIRLLAAAVRVMRDAQRVRHRPAYAPS